MRPHPKPLGERRSTADRGGLALVATLIVLAVIGLVVAGAVRAAMTSLRASSLDYREARAFYAAEAGAEAALSQLKIALQDGVLEDDELLNIEPPELEGFDYSAFEVERRDTAVVEDITDGPYQGLYALTQKVDISSVAEDANGTLSGVVLRAKAQAIPIFQFGVFYNDDLEATNGPPMEFVGRVHANGNIYLSSANAWYREPITTPNRVFHNRKDHNRVLDGVYIYDANTVAVPLLFDSRSIPGDEAFKAESCEQFDCRLQSEAFDVDSLKLPLPAGIPAYELITQQQMGDGDAEKSVKFAWKADLYVTVDFTNPRAWNSSCSLTKDAEDEDNVLIPTMTAKRPAGKSVPGQSQLCRMFRWQWSGFYDGRERELKDIVQIDIDEIDAWVAGDTDRQIDIIYVQINPPAPATFNMETRGVIIDGSIDPAIRVVDADELPNRMTIASEWPLYVRGNYNVTTKKPSALVGDGITILSTAWDDEENRPEDDVFEDCSDHTAATLCPELDDWYSDWTMKVAGETTVNAAILAGHWPTPCDWYEPTCPADGSTAYYHDWYGGGIENFPRFLERWRDGPKVVFHYLGALISPFTSLKTDGTWNGSYYEPPQRDWSFDTDFRRPGNLPPGTPNVGNVIRTAMREAF